MKSLGNLGALKQNILSIRLFYQELYTDINSFYKNLEFIYLRLLHHLRVHLAHDLLAQCRHDGHSESTHIDGVLGIEATHVPPAPPLVVVGPPAPHVAPHIVGVGILVPSRLLSYQE